MACGNNFKTYLVGGFSAIGGFLFGYHTGVISGVLTMQDFKKRMGIIDSNTNTTSEKQTLNAINGSIVGVLLLGCFLGSLIGGQTSDRFSRKYSIAIFSLIFTISSAIQTVSINLPMLLSGRFFAGISIGALSMIVPIYHSEIAATKVRGRVITLQQWAITIGIAISFWVNFGTSTNKSLVNNSAEWQIPLGLQMFPSLVLSIGILFCPFTPRWLISRDREDEAREVLMNIRSASDDEIEEEMNRIRIEIAYLRENEVESYGQLFRFPLLRPLILGIGIQVLQQLTGINSTMYYAPEIFNQTLHNTSQASPLLATGVYGCVNVIATIPTMIFIDKLGRRILLITGAIIMSISMLVVSILMGVYGTTNPDPRTGVDIFSIKSDIASWLIIVFIYIFVAGFAFSWGPIPWIYCTEIFPLTMRAKATSLTTAANWATNCAISFLVPTLLTDLHVGTFLIFSIFCAIMTGVVYFFYPETKNIHLEQNNMNERNRIFVPQWLENRQTHYNTFTQQPIVNQTHLPFNSQQNLVNQSNQINNSNSTLQNEDHRQKQNIDSSEIVN